MIMILSRTVVILSAVYVATAARGRDGETRQYPSELKIMEGHTIMEQVGSLTVKAGSDLRIDELSRILPVYNLMSTS